MAAEIAPAPRLRAGWRIVLFAVLFVGLTLVAGSVLTLLIGQSRWMGAVVSLVAAVLAGWGMLHWLDHRPAGALGFALGSAAGRESLAGFAIGAALLAATVLLLWLTAAAGWTRDEGTPGGYVQTLAGGLAFFAVAAAAEEALFRGYPFQALVEGIGAWPAMLLSSTLFALVHAGNPNVNGLALFNIGLAGIWLSVCYLRTRSLWFATGAHLGWNWTMASLLDFPVSGLGFDTPLYDVREAGADWWTGGPFGPEAGLAATLALVIGTAWLLRTHAIRPSPDVQPLRPLVNIRLGGWG